MLPRDDDGFVLSVVLGVISLVTVIALGGFYVAQNTLTEATRVSNENRAYQAAASGLDRELSVFTPSDYAAGVSPNGYAYGSIQPINTLDWFVVSVRSSVEDPSLGPEEFDMISVGGSGDTTETVWVRFMSFNLWDMNISGSENSAVGSGAGFNGNGVIIGKVYANGDFDWSGSGAILDGPIFVRNGVFNKQSAGSLVGLVDDPVPAYFDNPPTGSTSNMYTELKGSAPKIDVPWPTLADMDNWKSMAIADSVRNAAGPVATTTPVPALRHAGSTSDAQYNIFTGNVVFRSGATNDGTYDFGKAGSSPATGTVDEASSGDVLAVKNGILYINGVVYVDGNITIDSSIDSYMGKGLLVAKGTITVNGRFVPKGYDSGSIDFCEPKTVDGKSEIMPRLGNDCIGLVSLGDIVQSSDEWVSALVFSRGRYSATGTAGKFRGSMIVQGIEFQQPGCWLVTQTGVSAFRPNGLPALNNVNARGDWIRQ